MKCTHCKYPLEPHDTEYGAKRGALHCAGCGCCFQADGKTPREGVPVCDLASAPAKAAAPAAEDEPVAVEETTEEEPETPSRARAGRK